MSAVRSTESRIGFSPTLRLLTAGGTSVSVAVGAVAVEAGPHQAWSRPRSARSSPQRAVADLLSQAGFDDVQDCQLSAVRRRGDRAVPGRRRGAAMPHRRQPGDRGRGCHRRSRADRRVGGSKGRHWQEQYRHACGRIHRQASRRWASVFVEGEEIESPSQGRCSPPTVTRWRTDVIVIADSDSRHRHPGTDGVALRRMAISSRVSPPRHRPFRLWGGVVPGAPRPCCRCGCWRLTAAVAWRACSTAARVDYPAGPVRASRVYWTGIGNRWAQCRSVLWAKPAITMSASTHHPLRRRQYADRGPGKIGIRVAGGVPRHLNAVSPSAAAPPGDARSHCHAARSDSPTSSASGPVYDAARMRSVSAGIGVPIVDAEWAGPSVHRRVRRRVPAKATILVTGVKTGTLSFSVNENLHLGVLERGDRRALLLAKLAAIPTRSRGLATWPVAPGSRAVLRDDVFPSSSTTKVDGSPADNAISASPRRRPSISTLAVGIGQQRKRQAGHRGYVASVSGLSGRACGG